MAILSIVLISAMFRACSIVEGQVEMINNETLLSSRLALTHQIQAETEGKAYLFVGDTTGIPKWQVDAIVCFAVFARAYYGLNVTVILNATADDVIRGLDDSNTTAIWIFGHGKHDAAGQPVPRINMKNNTFITPTIVGTRPNLKDVIFHSCNQKLDAWKSLFPNASFHAWSGRGWQWLILLYEWGRTWVSAVEPPLINPLLEPKQLYCDIHGYYVVNITGVANDFPINEPLRSQFGSQRCNFYAVHTTTGERQVLFAVDIENGRITREYYNETIESTFDVLVNNEDLYQILENPSTIWNAYQSGSLKITPYIPADKDILFKGIARLFFGETETVGGIVVPVDKFGLLAPYIGLASTILAATVATAVYVKCVKRRKEKQ